MATTTLPMNDDGPSAASPPGGSDRREGAIRAGVLTALGRPVRLFRVAVVPVWGDYYRVNVMTGDDPTAVQIPQSYFVAADEQGNILASTPRIRKEYF